MSVSKIAYSITASSYHWMVALPLMGAVGTVLKAQQSPKEEKGKWMWRHKVCML
jgi:cytochrome b561